MIALKSKVLFKANPILSGKDPITSPCRYDQQSQSQQAGLVCKTSIQSQGNVDKGLAVANYSALVLVNQNICRQDYNTFGKKYRFAIMQGILAILSFICCCVNILTVELRTAFPPHTDTHRTPCFPSLHSYQIYI